VLEYHVNLPEPDRVAVGQTLLRLYWQTPAVYEGPVSGGGVFPHEILAVAMQNLRVLPADCSSFIEIGKVDRRRESGRAIHPPDDGLMVAGQGEEAA
jgi:hypothetical protein